MKYAFLIMGPYSSDRDHVAFADGTTHFYGVSSLEEAVELSKKLVAEGTNAIEVCGAFEESGAKAIIEATGGKVPVGYICNFPEQEELVNQVYGG